MLCRFEEYGCKVLMKKETLNDHEKICDFRIVSCPVIGCDEEVSISSYMKHLKEKHGDFCEISNDNKTQFEMNYKTSFENLKKHRRLDGFIENDEVFLWQSLVHLRQNDHHFFTSITLEQSLEQEIAKTATISFFPQILSCKEEAAKYRIRIKVSNQDKDLELSLKACIDSIDESDPDPAIEIDENFFRQLTEDGSFPDVEIQIESICKEKPQPSSSTEATKNTSEATNKEAEDLMPHPKRRPATKRRRVDAAAMDSESDAGAPQDLDPGPRRPISPDRSSEASSLPESLLNRTSVWQGFGDTDVADSTETDNNDEDDNQLRSEQMRQVHQVEQGQARELVRNRNREFDWEMESFGDVNWHLGSRSRRSEQRPITTSENVDDFADQFHWPFKIKVKNLRYGTTDDFLYEIFDYPDHVSLIDPRGSVAIISFSNRQEAELAILQRHNKRLAGRLIKCTRMY